MSNYEEVELLALIGSSSRLQVLKLLLDNEYSVGKLAEAVGISQSALSQHLLQLRKAKLVSTRREGQTVYYTTTDNRVRAILETLSYLYSPAAIRGRNVCKGAKT